MSLRVKNKEAKRERIHAAALRLFAKQGFQETTVAQIARAAKVATGTLFLYAPDKGALLAQVFCREVVELQERAFRQVDERQPFQAQVLSVFSTFYDFYDRDHALSRLILKELLFSAERSPEVAQTTREFIGGLAMLAVAAQERGEVRGDPLRIANIVFAGYWVCLVGWLGGAHASKEAALGELAAAVELVMVGVAAPRTKPTRGT